MGRADFPDSAHICIIQEFLGMSIKPAQNKLVLQVASNQTLFKIDFKLGVDLPPVLPVPGPFFRYMTGCPPEHLKEVMDLFSLTTLEICEGQQLDMEFESRCDVTEDEYIEMIRLKTAVLLAGSLKIGAILAGATAEDAENLYNFGMHIGVAFQLQDDLLDVYGDPEVFGKKIGGDILCNKKTYMLIKALNRADEKQHAELNRWLNAEAFQPSEKIEAVTEIYNQLNIRNICESKMREYYTFAMESLAAVAVAEDRKKELKNLVKLLMYREM